MESKESWGTSELLQHLATCTGGMNSKAGKNLLYYLQDRRKVLARLKSARRTAKPKQGARSARTYSEDQAETLITAIRCWAAGFSFEAIEQAIRQDPRPWELVPPGKVLETAAGLAELSSEFSTEPLPGVARLASKILECGSCVVELTAAHGGEARMATVGTPPRIRLTPLESVHRSRTSLQVPILGRKQLCIGYLQFFDRRQVGGGKDPGLLFDRIDEALAVLLAKEIAGVLELSVVLRASGNMLEKAFRAHTLNDYLRSLLDTALDVTKADRGDVFWLDEASNYLVVARQASRGDSSSRLVEGNRLPTNSISAAAFREKTPQLVDDITTTANYFEGWKETASELAIPLLQREGGDVVAVLNVESRFPAFFKRSDIALLSHLAGSVELITAKIDLQEKVLTRLSEVGTHDALARLIESAQHSIGLAGAAVFLADFRRGHLRGAASRPEHEVVRSLVYQFEGDYLVPYIFRREVPVSISDPWMVLDGAGSSDEPPPLEPQLLTKLDIRGATIGVPMFFGQKALGVMLAWFSKDRQISSRDSEDLETFCRLAVTTMATAAADKQRQSIFASMRELLRQMQCATLDLPAVMRNVLGGLVSAGWDRARIFDYNAHEDLFRCKASLGVQPPDALAGVEIRTNTVYARLTVEAALEGRLDPVVRIPGGTPDPHADILHKPRDLSWAVAPLSVNGILHGYIAADLALTRSQISAELMEYAGLYSAIASLALAMESSDSRPRGVGAKG